MVTHPVAVASDVLPDSGNALALVHLTQCKDHFRGTGPRVV